MADLVTPPSAQKSFFINMANASLVQSDFLESSITLRTQGIQVIAGSGGILSSNSSVSNTDHPGFWQLNTGTNALGRIFLLSDSTASYHIGVGGITRQGFWIRTGANLSDGTNRYSIRTGMFNMNSANVVVEGIGFEYQDNENGGRWQGITHDGTETSLDTGVTVAINTWYRLEYEVNSAGTSVEFFIDDVSVGTNTTNIPGGTGFRLFTNIHIFKTLGNTSRNFLIDAYYTYQELSR